MTPNETFFPMVYLNEPVYASRFRKDDRERIWTLWLRSMDQYCRKLDMDGVEVCWSGIRRRDLPKEGVLGRYSRNLENIHYIIADCGSGNRALIPPAECTYMLDDKVVFHTLNQYHVWSATENLRLWSMERENTRTLVELRRLVPEQRPAFTSIVGTSWVYRPSWVVDLKERLPPNFVMVKPGDLARLFRESLKEGTGKNPRRSPPFPAARRR